MEVLVLLLTCLTWGARAFNLDPRFPYVFQSQEKGDYFGFSVGLHAPSRHGDLPWLLVGAPKGSDARLPGIHRPGRTMHCGLGDSPTPCQQIHMRPATHANRPGERQEDSMLGSVQDMLYGRLVTCAPRWCDASRTNERYHILGMCYFRDASDINSFGEPVIPLSSPDAQIFRVKQANGRTSLQPYFLYGQAGFSAHIPDIKKNGAKELILGAPGIFNWKGSVVLYRDQSFDINQVRRKRSLSVEAFAGGPIVANPHESREVTAFGLLGYAVTSGRFFRESRLHYAASAPRAKSVGQVLIFVFPNLSHGRLGVHQELEGRQVGEYFGAALAAGDLNGDGLDDLLVGAPLFENGGQDEGRVAVFFGNSGNKLVPAPMPDIKGSFVNGRFGSAISCLGDLDNDGFRDFAISAPFDGQGVVYIYNGGRGGLSEFPTQRIAGSEYHPSISGFGYSLSRGQDVDGNGYNDLAVGAHRSGHVLVVRARPVVGFEISLTSEHRSLPRNSSTLTIRSCVKYSGHHLPESLRVLQTLEVDPRLRRLYLGSDQQRPHVSPVTLYRDSSSLDSCHHINLTVKPDVADVGNFLDPIPIFVKYDLQPDNQPRQPIIVTGQGPVKDFFCADCPVLRRDSQTTAELHVQFATDCGADNICNSKMGVQLAFHVPSHVETDDSSFVVGSSREVILRVTASNAAGSHPAYLAQVEVALPTRVLRLPPPCRELETNRSSRANILCDIANPLKPGTERTLELSMDMQSVSAKERHLRVRARTLTSSNDPGHETEASLPLSAKADISVFGSPDKELYPFDTKDEDEKEKTKRIVDVTFSYQIEKTGISPIDKVQVIVELPTALRSGRGFIQIVRPELLLRSNPMNCSSETMEFLDPTERQQQKKKKHANLDEEGPTSSLERRRKRSASPDSQEPDLAVAKKEDLPANRTLYVNCTRQDEWTCSRITCDVGPFPARHDTPATMRLPLVVDTEVLDSTLGQRDIIVLGTVIDVRIVEPKEIQQPPDGRPDQAEVTATLLGRIPKGRVATWVIALSVIGGISLLLLIVTGLIKAGFFKRKEKDALIKLKRETRMEFEAMQRASMAVPPHALQQETMEDEEDE